MAEQIHDLSGERGDDERGQRAPEPLEAVVDPVLGAEREHGRVDQRVGGAQAERVDHPQADVQRERHRVLGAVAERRADGRARQRVGAVEAAGGGRRRTGDRQRAAPAPAPAAARGQRVQPGGVAGGVDQQHAQRHASGEAGRREQH